jgi:hypothetical protein
MPEFVDNTVKDIDAQLRQLRDEVSRLEAARSALTGGRRRPGRPRGSATRATGARSSRARVSRARSTRAQPSRTRTARRTSTPSRAQSTRGARNTRAAQALELVRQRPGITIPEIAKAMKIQPNYLYRVLPRLASEGQIKRNGQGWHPAS